VAEIFAKLFHINQETSYGISLYMNQQGNLDAVSKLVEDGKNNIETNINEIGICFSDARRNWKKD